MNGPRLKLLPPRQVISFLPHDLVLELVREALMRVLILGVFMMLITCTTSSNMITFDVFITQCDFRNYVLIMWFAGSLRVR